MVYFLAKTEPGVYSISDLERDGSTAWTGVRNPQAVRALREMQPGDRIFIYHSTGESSVTGVAEAMTAARPDPDDAKSAIVDFRFICHLPQPITLREIKESHLFDEWALVRQSRLSTMAAPDAFVAWVRKRYPALSI
jgi:predicted RNA-binding protein with PUA-like domain